MTGKLQNSRIKKQGPKRSFEMCFPNGTKSIIITFLTVFRIAYLQVKSFDNEPDKFTFCADVDLDFASKKIVFG